MTEIQMVRCSAAPVKVKPTYVCETRIYNAKGKRVDTRVKELFGEVSEIYIDVRFD